MSTGCGNGGCKQKIQTKDTNKGGANAKMKKGQTILPVEEEKLRMTLYKQGLSDGQIAKKLGVTAKTICDWRKRRGLPAWFPAYRMSSRIGYPMRQALPPEKCAIVRRFLHDLVEYSKELPVGAKPDISAFLWEWRRTYSYCSEPGRTVKKRRSLS